jgi:hypothetical protein
MIAGSDLLKSGGVGGKVISKDVFNQLEERAQHLREGQKITVYLGNGSAIHRNSIVLEFYRTTQGIEMRLNGPGDVAMEYQAVTSRYMTDKMRRENRGEDNRLKPTAHDALMNVSNILNFSTVDQVNNIPDHHLRTVDYQEKYLTAIFGSLVETFPNQEMESAVTTAPRPKFRPDYNTDPNKVKVAEVGHQKMRAIGYGSNLYTASWGAVHAYFDISEFADKRANDGRLRDNAGEAAKNYLNSPYNVQDSINRSMYNQALFQPDMGLKFLEARFGNTFSINPSFDEEGKMMFEVKSGDKSIKINAEEYFLEMQKPLEQRNEEINKASYNLAGFFKTNQIPNEGEAKMAYEATISSMVLYWETVKANRTSHELLIELALQDKVIQPREAIELRKIQNPSSEDIRNLMGSINPDLGHEMNEKAGLLAFNREIVHKYFEEHMQQVRKLELTGDELKAEVTRLQTELHNNEELNYSLREIKRIAESPLEVPKHAQMFAKNCDELAIAA